MSDNLTKIVDEVLESLSAARKLVTNGQVESRKVGFLLDTATLGIKAITEYGKLLVEPESKTEARELREVDIAGTHTEREDVLIEEEAKGRKVGFN